MPTRPARRTAPRHSPPPQTLGPTVPTRTHYAPVGPARQRAARRRRPRPAVPGCLVWTVLASLPAVIFLAIYLFFPGRTNVLLLGIDYAEPGSTTSRSDTLMLATVIPSRPYVGLLSIPRDLWVVIPGIGQNRINTAHFYAESQQPGSGPDLALQTVRLNFGVDVIYYARVRFEGFREVVNALGGVDIELSEPTAGYPAGRHHLTGNKALAFVRNRAGTDDFFRMEQGQFMLKAVFKQLLRPGSWLRWPAVTRAALASIDTNLPAWMWPRLGFALLRVGPSQIDNHIITRQMTTPFFTDAGANVLDPNWELINPLVKSIFGP
ncbi:MAG: LCP family protein [Chloroflexota bacterium]